MNYEEQGTRNIALAGAFLSYLLDRPGELESIPDGAQLVLTNCDDPELSRANEELAEQLRARGESVIVRDVPTPAGR